MIPHERKFADGKLINYFLKRIDSFAANVGGLSEMVKDYETGLIIPSCQPNLIAGKIEEYFKNDFSEIFFKNINLKRH